MPRGFSPQAGARSRLGPPPSASRRSRRCRGSISSCSRRRSIRMRSAARIARAGEPSAFPVCTSPRCRSARSRTRRSAPRRSSCASTPISRIRSSPSPSRSSTSASRPTPSRAGSGRSRSACSATTARSTRSTATSPGARPGSGRAETSRRSRRRWTAAARIPRSSTTRSSCSCARTAWRSPRRCRCSFRPRGRTIRVSSAEVRDFHRYGAMLSEPWDGPAALCFTDGRTCGAALDRNGLRPLRVAVAGEELLAVSSEAGAVPMPDGVPLRRSRLGPGGVVTLDPDRGLLVDSELRRDLAARRPYGTWVESSIVRVDAGMPVTPPDGSLDARHVLHGYTREDLNGMLRPLAQSGHDPVSSMGDDSAISPLAGRDRPLTTYLRQRFAQVTNPAIDHLRERLVMSVSTLLGPRSPSLVASGPLPTVSVLPGFLLYPDRVDALEPRVLDATFTEEEGLRPAIDRLVVLAVAAVAAGDTLLCLSDAEAGDERAPDPGAARALGRAREARGDGPADGAARSSSPRTRRATRTPSPVCSATGPTRSARGSRSRRSPGWPRTTRSAAIARRRRRRSVGYSQGSRRACSRSCPRWASPTSPAIAVPGCSRRSASTARSAQSCSRGRPPRSAAPGSSGSSGRRSTGWSPRVRCDRGSTTPAT